uniref:Uncharacterized protein n=1 Tax=Arundo donax TaxID=35708 RepID=A0A0A9FBF7_ARUDO
MFVLECVSALHGGNS